MSLSIKQKLKWTLDYDNSLYQDDIFLDFFYLDITVYFIQVYQMLTSMHIKSASRTEGAAHCTHRRLKDTTQLQDSFHY